MGELNMIIEIYIPFSAFSLKTFISLYFWAYYGDRFGYLFRYNSGETHQPHINISDWAFRN